MPQQHRKEGSRNIRYECKYTYHQHNCRHPNMYIYRRHKGGNRQRHIVADAQKISYGLWFIKLIIALLEPGMLSTVLYNKEIKITM